jgi:hypothetical protein
MSSPSDRPGLRFNAWNLLLLVPLLMLVTPWYNFDTPRFIGIPFFYWFEFVWMAIAVLCTTVVYRMTRDKPTGGADRLSVDDLDEGLGK